MQIVIDIPNKVYKHCCDGEHLHLFKLEEYIKKGTPLPKGHGRIVDLDAIIDEYLLGGYIELDEDDISKIPIIIEADKGKEQI